MTQQEQEDREQEQYLAEWSKKQKEKREKKKRMEREEAFLPLPEEQTFKYFDIFKKTLSGKIGKNLLNLEYKLKESRSSDTEGEEHELLMDLRESKLRDPALLDEFYEKILTSYDCAEDYE